MVIFHMREGLLHYTEQRLGLGRVITMLSEFPYQFSLSGNP